MLITRNATDQRDYELPEKSTVSYVSGNKNHAQHLGIIVAG